MDAATMCELIAKNVKHTGGQAWLVGGAARDLVMGQTPRDYDMEVYGLQPETLRWILSRFGPVNEVGQAFAVFKVGDIDVSLPRTDSKIGPGHQGFAVHGDPFLSYKEACRRRDFTMNAILIDPLTGDMKDPYLGTWDLHNKILRAVDPTTFIEDPLRVLRAMQFAARFNLRIGTETQQLCYHSRHFLHELPVERIWAEMEKLLLAPTPSIGLNVGRVTGVIEALFPELAALWGCPQDPTWHPEGDVWIHTLQAVDIAAQSAVNLPRPQRLAAILGTLCHDLGKPGTTEFRNERVISHGHDEAGIDVATQFLDRLNVFSIDGYNVRGQVLALVAHHLKPAMFYNANQHVAVSDSAFRRLALKVDMGLLALVARADTLGRVPVDAPHNINPTRLLAINWFVERAAHLQITHAGPTPLLLGRHVLALGLPPGPRIGAICRAVFELQLDGKVTTLDEAIAATQQLITPLKETP